MEIEPRNVEVRMCKPSGKRAMPPIELIGQRLVMTQLDGEQRLCVVRPAEFAHSEAHDMGPYDADAFQVSFPESK